MNAPGGRCVGEPAIYISALHYEWTTLREAFDLCAGELGLDGIELSLHPSGRFPHVGPQHAQAIAGLAAENGLRLSGHIWDDLSRLGAEAGARRLLEWLDLARTMGIACLVAHGGSHDDQAEGIRIVSGVLGSVAPHYEAAGVILCIENHYAYAFHGCRELFSTADEFLELFRAVESPAVRFCLDYGHGHLNGNTEDLLRRLAPFLAYTHLADNCGDEDDHRAFGCGTIDWRSVLALTREVGYRGPFTVEFPVRSATGRAFGQCVAMLRELFG